MTVDLSATDTRPLIHEGRAIGLTGGDYRVVLRVENADLGGEEVATELLVTERTTTELAELAANRNLLEQMAAATEGRLFLPDQLDELPALFEDVTESESLREEITLWDHWLDAVDLLRNHRQRVGAAKVERLAVRGCCGDVTPQS